MNKIILESERLLLRPLSFDDLINIEKGTINLIKVHINQNAIFDFTKSAISKKIKKMEKVPKDIHEWYTYWLIVDKNTKSGIGFIGFKGTPDEGGHVEVGYSISCAYRKQGLMTEALSLLSNWASKNPDLKGITACKVLKTNTGSNRVLKNCNFKLASSSEEFNYYLLDIH
ncbi:RimJ/RimL family protein N-acetyltransferase [Clostridium acetobutylicum]|uniref:Predicted acetyltransferase n=1 Tax=Clostridium acetobutylicum (strain ATCC 824 / DSM 792 / JCM 1419 / IAM 19013 / LMG 5710 / NBRC 13948 / NRRL B-527 / VKM B-1787 / 2291 / W) TaxID=272562 RepID=Q97M31_CLOAB|nr:MULTISPECIES: GNAT family N-acetyltransferase [Clostridium]AAK78349.1 Predicted acetyltransferase [Clostridium acetobutylicum ATCC 824]ADZ19418.1 acetyltransferase [Clostridium acetobutylicum EA 2018]AEI31202.1 acetyltransferase [Clostridium acetobutylicum DSM 1731]AWV80073.1 N-acetyltransferase [Clostridium acetobutylicum]MBC2395895.1 GNAT family N-acetyltransferase [Clostridium acetobutylicum]